MNDFANIARAARHLSLLGGEYNLDEFLSSYLSYAKLPALHARYACLVDGCEWTADVPGPVFEAQGAPDGYLTSDTLKFTWTGVDPDHVEQVLQAHFDSHTTMEWLGTINRLHSRVAELEASQEAPDGD